MGHLVGETSSGCGLLECVWRGLSSLHKEAGAKCHLMKSGHFPAGTEESLKDFRQKSLAVGFLS